MQGGSLSTGDSDSHDLWKKMMAKTFREKKTMPRFNTSQRLGNTNPKKVHSRPKKKEKEVERQHDDSILKQIKKLKTNVTI